MKLLSFISGEVRALPGILSEYRTEAVILVTASLVMVLEYYYTILNGWFTNLLLFFLVPVFVIVVLLRRNPFRFGLGIGKPKLWLFHTLIFCLVAWVTLTLVSANPDLIGYYGDDGFNLSRYVWTTVISLFASEFLFRGFLLFGLRERFGPLSIFIQTVPFVLVHLGKPDLETLSTVVTGIWFGYICYRGESFWPALIVHLFINIFFVATVNL